jgi:hypothetical protein
MASQTDGRCRRKMEFVDDVQRSVERIVPRGQEIYEHRVRPRLRQEDEGAFVAIDVESGDCAIASDEEEASARVEARRQGAVFFFSRVGPGGEAVPAHRIGAGDQP